MSTPRKDDGAVLLTTLLVMSLMATLAVAIMDDVRFAVKRAINVQAYAQADWYMRGAEDFAASYISQQINTADPAQLNAGLMEDQLIVLPIDGGTIALSVRDGSHCISLSALGGAAANRTFRQLLTALDWGENDAARLTTLAIDWQDADTQTLPGGAEDYAYLGQVPARRTSNTVFGSVTELRELGVLSEEQYQMLRPFVCAQNSVQPIAVNINTLTPEYAPLLAAILGGAQGLATASRLIADRPASGYADITALRAAPALQNFDLNTAQLDQISYAPNYIWIEAQIDYQNAQRRAAFEFGIADNATNRLYRGYGDDALRPKLESPDL